MKRAEGFKRNASDHFQKSGGQYLLSIVGCGPLNSSTMICSSLVDNYDNHFGEILKLYFFLMRQGTSIEEKKFSFRHFFKTRIFGEILLKFLGGRVLTLVFLYLD